MLPAIRSFSHCRLSIKKMHQHYEATRVSQKRKMRVAVERGVSWVSRGVGKRRGEKEGRKGDASKVKNIWLKVSFEIHNSKRKKHKARQKKSRKHRRRRRLFWVKCRLEANAVILSPLPSSMTHFMSCQIRRVTYEKALEQAIILPLVKIPVLVLGLLGDECSWHLVCCLLHKWMERRQTLLLSGTHIHQTHIHSCRD